MARRIGLSLDILSVLQKAVEENVSDIFIIAGAPISFKIGDSIKPWNDSRLMPEDTEDCLLYTSGQHD